MDSTENFTLAVDKPVSAHLGHAALSTVYCHLQVSELFCSTCNDSFFRPNCTHCTICDGKCLMIHHCGLKPSEKRFGYCDCHDDCEDDYDSFYEDDNDFCVVDDDIFLSDNAEYDDHDYLGFDYDYYPWE